MPRSPITDFGISARDLPNKVVIPELDALNFIPNGHGMPLHDLTLRPGQHRRVSFRATPPSSVEIAVRAHEWFDLDLLNASRSAVPPLNPFGAITPAEVSATTLAATETPPSPTNAPRRLAFRTTPDLVAHRRSITDDAGISSMRAAAIRPVGGRDILNPRGIFDPFDPFDPLDPLPPTDLPPKLTFPVEVVVSVRDGQELDRDTLHAIAGSPSPAKFEVESIDGNEVIDVTFINPNDQAIICTYCRVSVKRKVRSSVTRMDTEMFLRAFNGAVESLNPKIYVIDGQVRVSLEGEIAEHLGIENIRWDLPASFSGGATFDADELEIMSLHEMIRMVIELRHPLIFNSNNTEGIAEHALLVEEFGELLE
ncbi:MAG: hypothetical protein U5S82_17145 [Gammaproteobacteria bacterium]|nr:hypothetical protein [Gammaproteobacteria bacterium]